MRKKDLLSAYQQRLAQLCFSGSECLRSTRELADHFDDLKAGALEEGLSEAQAEERAAGQLGDPRALAERLAAALRQSSWWGRHPLIGFCLLPSVGYILLMALMVLVALLTLSGVKVFLPAAKWEALAAGGAGFDALKSTLHGAFCVSFLALMIIVCRLAHRAAVGLKWTLTACFLSSLQATFFFVTLRPHNLAIGYSWSWITGTYLPDFAQSNWVNAVIPLLCAAVVVARQRRVARRLALTLLVAGLAVAPAAMAAEKPCLQRGWIGGEYKVSRRWSSRALFFPPPEVIYDRSFPKSVQRLQNAAINITALETNTPAAVAGLRKGDWILDVDHSPVTRLGDFRRQIDARAPGTSVTLTVYRDGQTLEIPTLVGKETFRHGGCFSIGLLPIVRPWSLIPDAGVSVVFAGWEPQRGLRHASGAKSEVYNPAWTVWLGIFDVSVGTRVVSQTNAETTSTTRNVTFGGT